MKNFPFKSVALALWTLALVLVFNTSFGVLTTTSGQMGANDVASIMRGFHQTPHFWSDFGRWWHGPWIQSGVEVYRPLASMMLWWECYVGLHAGFVYVAWWGVFLVTVACGLSVCIAWRVTGSWLSAWLAATLLPALRFWNWSGTTPDSWAAWMPVHHDLLMIIALLAASLGWSWWLEGGRRRHLFGCWLALIVGACTKEYVYIFPSGRAHLGFGHAGQIGFAPANVANLRVDVCVCGAFISLSLGGFARALQPAAAQMGSPEKTPVALLVRAILLVCFDRDVVGHRAGRGVDDFGVGVAARLEKQGADVASDPDFRRDNSEFGAAIFGGMAAWNVAIGKFLAFRRRQRVNPNFPVAGHARDGVGFVAGFQVSPRGADFGGAGHFDGDLSAGFHVSGLALHPRRRFRARRDLVARCRHSGNARFTRLATRDPIAPRARAAFAGADS